MYRRAAGKRIFSSSILSVPGNEKATSLLLALRDLGFFFFDASFYISISIQVCLYILLFYSHLLYVHSFSLAWFACHLMFCAPHLCVCSVSRESLILCRVAYLPMSLKFEQSI